MAFPECMIAEKRCNKYSLGYTQKWPCCLRLLERVKTVYLGNIMAPMSLVTGPHLEGHC